jgi:F0F1-type ATP synthase membrane subunit c/vacuolar-type H+-ATPase subunit K
MDAIARQPEASGKIQTAMLMQLHLLKVLVSQRYSLLN